MSMIIRGALRATARLAALALAATFVACGGDSSDDTPITYDNHLPLQVGDRWVYREHGRSVWGSGTTTTIWTETVVGTLEIDGTPYHQVQRSAGTPLAPSLYAVSPSGIRARYAFYPSEYQDLVRFPTHEGATFDQDSESDGDRDLDGKPDRYSSRVTTSIVGVETLSTPAGQFSGALHVREFRVTTVRLSNTGADSTTTGTRDTWYVPGVGRVRWESRDEYHASVGELMRHVPAGRPDPDTTPPVLVRAGPPSGTALHAGEPLMLVFDEPVLSASLDVVTVTLDGRAVHLNRIGPYDPEGRTVNLIAPFGWEEGTHTIRVAEGIQDLAGNTMLPLPDSTFSVSSEFALVYTNIPRFAIDTDTFNAPLWATMNQSIDRSTLTAVRLRENGVVVPATVSLDNPKALQVTPIAPLKAPARYTVDLTGLKNVDGHPIANPLDWTFTTGSTITIQAADARRHELRQFVHVGAAATPPR